MGDKLLRVRNEVSLEVRITRPSLTVDLINQENQQKTLCQNT